MIPMPFPSTGADGTEVNTLGIVSAASNIRQGDNPPYTVADFLSVYPGFGPDADGANAPVPNVILEMYVGLANASLKEARYHDAWAICMGLFVAHFATLCLEGTAKAGSPAGKVLEAGKARGLRTSEVIGDISASYDYNAIAQDLDGWAAWKLTIYGQQLATLAKLHGRAA
jgi:hypothetical protein